MYYWFHQPDPSGDSRTGAAVSWSDGGSLAPQICNKTEPSVYKTTDNYYWMDQHLLAATASDVLQLATRYS